MLCVNVMKLIPKCDAEQRRNKRVRIKTSTSKTKQEPEETIRQMVESFVVVVVVSYVR